MWLPGTAPGRCPHGPELSAVSGQGGQCHVPFRDSKLTLLLKDSLVGSFRSTVIAAVSPAAPAGPDTYSTLRFASRARHILLPVSTGGGPGARELLRGLSWGALVGAFHIQWESPSPGVR